FERQPGEEARILKGERNTRMRTGKRRASHTDRAAGRTLKARQDAQQARFSHPARAENADCLARLQIQVEMPKHVVPAAGIAQGIGACLKNRRFAHAISRVAARRSCASITVLSCTMLGVTIGMKALSRKRR